MTETSNYALNIVEGSDLFNPLTQFNPNFEQIDTVMAENEQAGVGIATELKSGTTHAIIRENVNRSIFYFTATSDYEAGDTFTVDGGVVTAKLPSGESLGTGAFVVNSTVLCSIVGSLLTVYSSKGGITTAADSERLGGELPSYYATAEELLATDAKADSAGSVAQSANAISIQNQNAINTLNGQIGNINIYVGEDGYLHYVNKEGADSVLPFSRGLDFTSVEFFYSNTFTAGSVKSVALEHDPKILLITGAGTHANLCIYQSDNPTKYHFITYTGIRELNIGDIPTGDATYIYLNSVLTNTVEIGKKTGATNTGVQVINFY